MNPLLGCQHHHHQEAWNMSSCTSCGVFYGKRRLQSINHCHPDTPMHKRSRTQYQHTTTTPTNQHPMQQNRPPLLAPLQNPNHVQPSFGRACRVPKIPPLPLQNPGHVLPPEGLISSSKQQTGHDDATGLEFDHAKLKERQESAIRSLYADLPRQCATCGLRFKTQGEHGQHMDWHVRKNRAAKSKSKQMQTRKWFPSSGFLLKASEANGISNAGTPAFFATSTVEEENNFVEQLAVFADEDQRECPLCMETFDDYFSNETNDWVYRGTVYMNEAKASTRRLYKSLVGRIVHAKCLIHKHLLLHQVMFVLKTVAESLSPRQLQLTTNFSLWSPAGGNVSVEMPMHEMPPRMEICVPNSKLSSLHGRLYALLISNICNG